MEISISPPEIARYYNIPLYLCDFVQCMDLMYFLGENMEDIINLLKDGKGEWKCHLGTDYPISLSQTKLTSKARIVIKTKPYLGDNALLNSEWIVRWMQEVRPIFEDYARKSGLKLPQFPATKCNMKKKMSKINKENELEEEEDPNEELKGNRAKQMKPRILILTNLK
ncbi:hypothetical protein Gotur_017519 [Gossypium turneri]